MKAPVGLLSDRREDWDAAYGDRINQLVFIGKGYEKQEILNLLNACIEVSTT